MKTIEERAIIDKACEWLKKNLPTTTEEEARSLRWRIITPENLNVLIGKFRKAMEQ